MTEDTATQPTAPTDAGGQPADAANQPTPDTLPPKKAAPRRKVAARKSVPAVTIETTDNGADAAVAPVRKPARVRKPAAAKSVPGKEQDPAAGAGATPAVREQVEASSSVASAASAKEDQPARSRDPQAHVETQVILAETYRAVEEQTALNFRPGGPGEQAAAAASEHAPEPAVRTVAPVPSAPVLPAAPEKDPAPAAASREYASEAETPATGLVAPSPSVVTTGFDSSVSQGTGQQTPANRDNFQSPEREGQPGRPNDQQGRPNRFDRQNRHGRNDRRDRFSPGGGQQGQGSQGGQGNQGGGQRDQRDFQGQGGQREPRDFSGQGRDNRDGRDGRDGQPQGIQGQGGGDGFVSRVAEPQFGEGIVEVSGKGFGFLREAKRNFVQTPADVFVTPEVCRKYNLRDGQWIKGEVRRSSRGPQLFRLTELNGEDPEKFKNLPNFDELTSINPKKRIRLETVPERYTTRVMDLMTPIGKGQRGLLVAPPRTGKTTLLQHIAEAVIKNHPEMKVIILLVDERPEEVTEIRRAVPQAEIMASSNDSDLKSHTRIAQLAMERAKRLVEAGFDVFMLLDSITRMGRAFNNTASGSRTGSGGIDSRALEIPRKIFAAARNTEEAGSLTIMATALIDTGSRGDEVIFLEFKGTGNMELVLDRKISDQRIYPAVDIFQSGTRREELLLQPWELDKINVIRRGLAGHKPLEAIERLLSFLKKFPTNAQMLTSLPG